MIILNCGVLCGITFQKPRRIVSFCATDIPFLIGFDRIISHEFQKININTRKNLSVYEIYCHLINPKQSPVIQVEILNKKSHLSVDQM